MSTDQLKLRWLAANGDAKELQIFLATFFDLNKEDFLSFINDTTAIDIGNDLVNDKSPFVSAVIAESVSCMELLLKYGAEPHRVDSLGRSPLHWAVFHDKYKSVKLLLAVPVDQMTQDLEGQTALMLSTTNKSTKNCQALLKAHVHPPFLIDLPDVRGMSALFWAAYNGSLEHVKLLLKYKPSMNMIDLEGKSVLHWGVAGGNVEIARLLLWEEFIDLQDKDLRTCLHIAVGSMDLAMTQFLLRNTNCDPTIQDDVGRTPLHWAAQLNRPDILRELISARGAQQYYTVDLQHSTALHYVVQHNDAQLVHALLFDPNVRDLADNLGKTALIWAATANYDKCVEALLTRKYLDNGQVDVNVHDSKGSMAIHAAAVAGAAEICAMLLSSGAAPNSPDAEGLSPIFYAAEQGHVDTVNVLLEYDANPSQTDDEGRNSLHFAALSSFADVCELLVSKGQVDPNSVDSNGRSAIQTAGFVGSLDCVNVLLSYGADPDMQDVEGMTALMWAASGGFLECCKSLVLTGHAQINTLEFHSDHFTAYDFAVAGNHMKVAKFLKLNGGLSSTEIRHQCADRIKAFWKAYQFRKSFISAWNIKQVRVHPPPAPVVVKKEVEVPPEPKPKKEKPPKKQPPPEEPKPEPPPPPPVVVKPKTPPPVVVKQVTPPPPPPPVIKKPATPPLVVEPEPPRPDADINARLRARRERERMQLVRRKMDAAVVIQRAWRCFRFRRNMRGPVSPKKHHVPHQPKKAPTPQPPPKQEYTEYEREVAALVIQLAWRKHMRRRLKSHMDLRLKKRSEILRAIMERQRRKRQEKAYLSMVPHVTQWAPASKHVPTPGEAPLPPSLAITSFNMAVSIYRAHCGIGQADEFNPEKLLQSVNVRYDHLMSQQASRTKFPLRSEMGLAGTPVQSKSTISTPTTRSPAYRSSPLQSSLLLSPAPSKPTYSPIPQANAIKSPIQLSAKSSTLSVGKAKKSSSSSSLNKSTYLPSIYTS